MNNDNEMEKFRIRAKVVKAMAHPTRLFIMSKLSDCKYCVSELQEMIGSDLSTISKHLAVLKNAGILIDHKDGTQVYYALKVPCIMDFMSCIETLIKQNAVQQLSNL